VDFSVLKRIDYRIIPIIALLMVISLLVISSVTTQIDHLDSAPLLTPLAKNQLKRFVLGWVIFFALAAFDYRKLRNFTWFLYLFMILLLIGVLFTAPVHSARRWYRIPFIGFAIQPSEYAKLIVVMTLSWFLEKKSRSIGLMGSALQAGLIALIPFMLILKQPDLGSALVLYPITLVMFYFGGVNKWVIRIMLSLMAVGLAVVLTIFSGLISHEAAKPVATKVLKEYQYERLRPDTYHQRASKIAIALGGVKGSGFRKSRFTGRKWLPEASTDSVFAAYAEEYGLAGVLFLLLLFLALIYCGFEVTTAAKDHYGRLLSSGITVYLAFHVIVNVGMMCKLLPITGVPLVLVTYGGSSVLTTMGALGLLQSIYTRRFMF